MSRPPLSRKRSLFSGRNPPFRIVALCTSGIVLFLCAQLAYGLYFHLASGSWDRVEARVVDIRNERKTATLHYQYLRDGIEYSGERYKYLPDGFLNEKAEINRSFHKGQSFPVYVNPKNPAQSVARRYPLRFGCFFHYFLFMGFSSAVFIVAWRES